MKLSLKVKEKIFAAKLMGEVHASTLLRLDDGSFLASCFYGTKEGNPNVGICGAKRSADGRWSKPKRWAKVVKTAHWNPVLFQRPDSKIELFFKIGVDCSAWKTWRILSSDGGKRWGKPRELVPGDETGGRGPVKNKAIVLSDGSILAPASRELEGKWRVFCDRSEDGGETWTASAEPKIARSVIVKQGVIQPTLWESEPGKVHMLMRSSCGFVCRSDSSDYGKTWSEVKATTLPNNNSGIDLAKGPDGSLLLCYNKVGKNWGPRSPLNLAASTDDGKTWEDLLELETEPGEYSYPAVIATPEGFAGTYTWKRESVVFWEASLSR